MPDTYAPTRLIMTSEQLATFKIGGHGRNYHVCDDGYDDMDQAAKAGWHVLSSWGRDGWDLGKWPYVSFQTIEKGGRFILQTIVEGDHDLWSFPTQGDRDAAIDYLFLWYAADEEWAPLTWQQRAELDAGTLDVDPKFRGPYRNTED